MIDFRNAFRKEQKVRFRNGVSAVPTHYLRPGITGIVVDSYFCVFGVGMREEVDVEFSIAEEKSDRFVKICGIPADQLQGA